MSWGVATQNGVSVSLASIVSLSAGVTEFSPADLFTGGVQGAWYDPSDYSTLFQDSAGTTPVTAVEQPVGLMLDKSQGLVLGSELVTGAASAYSGNGTVATVGDTITATCTTNGIYGITWTSSAVSNLWALCTFEVVTNSASKFMFVFLNGNVVPFAAGNTTGSRSFIAFAPTATGSTARPIFYINGLAGESFSVRLVSIKSYAGNHASQATAASRPVLRARYNLLTFSEQFDNAAWTKRGAVTAANTTSVLAPDGSSTADIIQNIGTSGIDDLFQQNSTAPLDAPLSPSFYIYKISSTGTLRLQSPVGNSRGVWLINLSLLSVGWERITATHPAVTISTAFTGSGSSNNGILFAAQSGGPLSFYLWGADLRTGSSAGTYQRIAAATDYATAGFAPYLAADGTDDNMVIPATAISGATALTEMHAAWRPAGFGSGNGVVFGGTGTATTNDHEPFSDGALYYGFASSARQAFGSLGTVTTPYILDATQTGTTLAAYRNGTQLSTTATVSIGIGATPRLFVSNNSTLQYYQGNFFGGLMIKKVLSAAETSAARSWFATKAGITL